MLSPGELTRRRAERRARVARRRWTALLVALAVAGLAVGAAVAFGLGPQRAGSAAQSVRAVKAATLPDRVALAADLDARPGRSDAGTTSVDVGMNAVAAAANEKPAATRAP